MDDTTASLAVYHGPATHITEHETVDEAIRAAEAAVARKGAIAAVRDASGVMVYAADWEGRRWNRGEPIRPWGKHLREDPN